MAHEFVLMNRKGIEVYVTRGVARKFIKGDDTAFRIVYTSYRKLLYFLILNHVETKEEAEEAFYRAFRKISEGRNAIKSPSYLEDHLFAAAKEAINEVLQERQGRENPAPVETEEWGLNLLLPYPLNREEKVVVGYRLCFELSWKETSRLSAIPISGAKLLYDEANEVLKHEFSGKLRKWEVKTSFQKILWNMTPKLENVPFLIRKKHHVLAPILGTLGAMAALFGLYVALFPYIPPCLFSDCYIRWTETLRFADYQTFKERIEEFEKNSGEASHYLIFNPDSVFYGSFEIESYEFLVEETVQKPYEIDGVGLEVTFSSSEGYSPYFKSVYAQMNFLKASPDSLGQYTEVSWTEVDFGNSTSVWEGYAVGEDGVSTKVLDLEFGFFSYSEIETSWPELWGNSSFEAIREGIGEAFTSTYFTN